MRNRNGLLNIKTLGTTFRNEQFKASQAAVFKFPENRNGIAAPPNLVDVEQLQHLSGPHALQSPVVFAHDRVRDVQFELLQAEDLLLERAARYEAVHVDHFLLSDTVRAIHRLRHSRGFKEQTNKQASKQARITGLGRVM